MKVFGSKPSISIHSDAGDYVSIVLADVSLSTVLNGRAPATGITIDQAVDYSISKSLKQDFIVDTFGDSPVKITLEGIEFLTSTCGENQDETIQQTIETFYDNNKLSADRTKRVLLGLSTNPERGSAFTCVLTGMRSVIDREGADKMYVKYSLTLIGVRNI